MPPTESRREIKENTESKPPKKRKAPAFFIKIRKVFLFCSFILYLKKEYELPEILCFFLENSSFFSSEKRTENLIFPFSRGKISYVNLKKTAISRFSYYIIEIMWYERLPSGYPRGSGWRGIVRQGGW